MDRAIMNGETAVVGFVFDYNKNKTNTDKYDFCVLGVSLKTKEAYVEHYSNVEMLKSMDVPETQSAIGTADEYIFGNGEYGALTTGTHYTYDSTAKKYTFIVELKQTANSNTYDIYMYAAGQSASASNKLGSYAPGTNATVKTIDKKTYAVGGVGVYGNVGNGVKVVANYNTDKNSITGSFMDEVVEE